MEHRVLELFHPLIRNWFATKVGTPTDIQARAWPHIARGEHVLILSRHTGLSSYLLTRRLWQYVWQGRISNDSFAVLRRGILSNFAPLQAAGRRGRSFSRRGFSRWSASRPLTGNWFLLHKGGEHDLLQQEELVKDRIRQLFWRYGVLFRELLQQELPAMQWRRIF